MVDTEAPTALLQRILDEQHYIVVAFPPAGAAVARIDPSRPLVFPTKLGDIEIEHMGLAIREEVWISAWRAQHLRYFYGVEVAPWPPGTRFYKAIAE